MATCHRYTELIPPSNLGSLGYEKFNIFRDDLLGRGSYGTVYKAVYDDLPCAAKILHPTLVDGATGTMVQQFEQECQVLSKIKHPNVVLYLGLRTDPVSQSPVLLMELLDESLTKMLQRSRNSLPYCVEVDLCHDISLALSYLHSHDIIHRDLSSNNVLIAAKRIAKVTDFGMSCFTDHLNRTRLTSCPGTEEYMPPEAFSDHPVYTKQLDVFSLGVIIIQVLTRLIPNPTPRTREVTNCTRLLHQQGRYRVIIPECERREEHINLIYPPTHPLLETALQCIRDDPSERPEASKLCTIFKELKFSPMFMESRQQCDSDQDTSFWTVGGASVENARLKTDLHEKERQISSLLQELSERERVLRTTSLDTEEQQAMLTEYAQEIRQLYEVNQKLTTTLQLRDSQLQQNDSTLRLIKEDYMSQIEEMNKSLRASEREIAHLQETNRIITEEKQRESATKDSLLSIKESQITSLNETQRKNERCIADFETTIRNLQQQLKGLQLQQRQHSPDTTPCGVHLKSQSNAPIPIHRGASAVHNGMAYFAFKATILTYNMHSRKWGTLSDRDCPLASGGFTVAGEFPTMVGGEKGGRVTGDLVSFVDGMWIETFPSMPTPRIYSSAITCYSHLIVAGGSSSMKLGSDILPIVEVMDITIYQSEQAWSTVCSLPHPLANTSVVLHRGQLVLLGGTDRNRKTLVTLTCDILTLLKSKKVCTRNSKSAKAIGIKLKKALDPTSKRDSAPPLWTRMGDTRQYYATCVSIGGQLLAVGGCGTNTNCATTVDRYNTRSCTWEEIGCIGTPRWLCYAVGLPGDDLMVVGGYEKLSDGDGVVTDKVEISTIDY